MKSTGKELVKQQENLDLEILNGDIEKADEEGRRILSVPFSYDKFIAYGKNIQKRTLQDDLNLARLLYRANQELSQQGYRSDLDEYKNDITSLTNLTKLEVKPKTFQDFCLALGFSKVTGYKRLATYNAEEDRLYTKEEIRAMAEEAWESLCEDIRYHRAHGEPSWKPEKWNDSLEFRYEQWLIQKGYRKADPIRPEYLGNISLPSDSYPLIGPFTFEFIDTIGHYCLEETSGNGAERFYDMCQRYKGCVPKGVEPNAVLRIPVLVKGAIAQLPAEARRDATILVANILRDYVEGEV